MDLNSQTKTLSQIKSLMVEKRKRNSIKRKGKHNQIFGKTDIARTATRLCSRSGLSSRKRKSRSNLKLAPIKKYGDFLMKRTQQELLGEAKLRERILGKTQVWTTEMPVKNIKLNYQKKRGRFIFYAVFLLI